MDAAIALYPRNPEDLYSAALSEAADWVIAKCFAGLRLHAVRAYPLEFNHGYIRFLEGKGSQRQGVLRRVAQLAGKFYGRVLMHLLEQEWLAAAGR